MLLCLYQWNVNGVFMPTIATTPKPPYFAVIFTSIKNEGDNGYHAMAQQMLELAKQQEGFLGIDSARESVGITVSYWSDLESIKRWKSQSEHQQAQAFGRSQWYAHYNVRIARVEKEYAF